MHTSHSGALPSIGQGSCPGTIGGVHDSLSRQKACSRGSKGTFSKLDIASISRALLFALTNGANKINQLCNEHHHPKPIPHQVHPGSRGQALPEMPDQSSNFLLGQWRRNQRYAGTASGGRFQFQTCVGFLNRAEGSGHAFTDFTMLFAGGLEFSHQSLGFFGTMAMGGFGNIVLVLELFHPLIQLQHLPEVVPKGRQLACRSKAEFRLALVYGVQHAPLEKVRQVPEEVIQLRQGLAVDGLVELPNSTPLGPGNSRGEGVPHPLCFLLDLLRVVGIIRKLALLCRFYPLDPIRRPGNHGVASGANRQIGLGQLTVFGAVIPWQGLEQGAAVLGVLFQPLQHAITCLVGTADVFPASVFQIQGRLDLHFVFRVKIPRGLVIAVVCQQLNTITGYIRQQ